MKRMPRLLLNLFLLASLLSGCAPGTGGKPQMPATKPSTAPPQTVQKSSAPAAKKVAAGVSFSRLNAPPLDTVDFLSARVGYLGGKGVIFKTGDGGMRWVKLYAGPENITQIDAVAQNDVWAATDKGYLLHSTDGRHFQRCAVPAGGKGAEDIRQIRFFADHSGYVLAGGVVKRLAADGKWGGATPPVPVDSIAFPTAETGFAAGANLVYRTTDGGEAWRKVFTAPVNTRDIGAGRPHWRASIHAGTPADAWLLVYGGAEGMSQVAYVLFHTTDGKIFTPLMDEGYWASSYPHIHLPINRQLSDNLGPQPGPFTVNGTRLAWFIGLGPGKYPMQLTRTDDDGDSFHMTGLGRIGDPAAPDFFSPMTISFVDSDHGWVAGSHGKHGALMYTTDGYTFRDAP